MDHNLAAVLVHLEEMDNKPVEYDNKCNACGEGFDNGTGGVKIQDEKFCRTCHGALKEIDFYREECGLSDREINDLLNDYTIHI
jgi:hypothetical protein